MKHNEQKSYRFYQAMVFLTLLAFRMLSVAVGWHVYELTGSALDLGYVGLVQFVPALLLAPVAGQIADRFNKRSILFFCQASLIFGTAGVCYYFQSGGDGIWPIYILLFVIGAALSFYYPATASMLPRLVSAEFFPRAVASVSSLKQVAAVLGPALGGAVCGATNSAVMAYGTCGVISFLAFLSLLGQKGEAGRVAVKQPVTLESLFAGFSYLWREKLLLGIVTLDLFAVLLGGAVALLPVYAKDILHVGPQGLGILRSLPAVGAFSMAFYLSRYPLDRHVGVKMLGAVAAFGVCTVVFGLSTNFFVSSAALFGLGCFDMISVVGRQTLVQLNTPDEMRGRVSAVSQLSIVASNQLGEFESGASAALLGTVTAVVLGGVGTCVIVAIWALAFPVLRTYDRILPKASAPLEASRQGLRNRG